MLAYGELLDSNVSPVAVPSVRCHSAQISADPFTALVMLKTSLTAVVSLATLLLSASSASAGITLVRQLDPFAGNNRYADVWGDGDFAYVGSFNGSGAAIFDVSDPANAFLAGFYNPGSGGQFKDVKVHNGIGYFASDNDGGVHIVDVSDPTNPTLLSQILPDDGGYDHVHNVSVHNGFLYEADSRTNVVKVFDVSDPSNPFFVRDIVTTDSRFIHDVTAVNGRLFTSGFGGSTDIYDISNVGTEAPALLGTIASGSNSHSSYPTPDGNFLVSAREISNGDVRIYDITDPSDPELVSVLNRTNLGIEAFSPHNPIVMDGFLYISWYQAGLVLVDINDPSNPHFVDQFDTFPGPVSGFDGNWGVYPFLGPERVLLSDMDGGLFIVDASGAVPEPTSVAVWLVIAGGTAGFAGIRRRRRAIAS